MMGKNAKEAALKYKNPPIVEAVLDIDCDTRSDFDLAAVQQAAHDAYCATYPILKVRHLREHRVEQQSEADATFSVLNSLHALLFMTRDQKQIVQIRRQGFSFNRLAPYSSLDDYIPDMERAWSIFLSVVRPVQIRALKLRYINRILLPLTNNKTNLDKYLKLGPRVPDEDRLALLNFMSRNVAVDTETGHQVKTILASQDIENNQLPVILDIEVIDRTSIESLDWVDLEEHIDSLRGLKNRVFEHTLNDACLERFQ